MASTHAGRQFGDDLVEELGVEQMRRLAERAERDPPQTELLVNLFQGRCLLNTAKAGQHGIEEVQQQQQRVVVEILRAVTGPIAVSSGRCEPLKQGFEHLEIFKPLEVFGEDLALLPCRLPRPLLN